nr:semaphorin-5A-like [Lytechinus pictus]
MGPAGIDASLRPVKRQVAAFVAQIERTVCVLSGVIALPLIFVWLRVVVFFILLDYPSCVIFYYSLLCFFIQNALYVGLPEAIVKVPVERCHQFTTQTECLNARDPYCGWHQLRLECTTYPEDPLEVEVWIQDITGCPIMDNTVDGKFGEWSNWTQCSDPLGLEACMCRYRDCDSPAPKCGGTTCIGEYQQVVNCTGRPSGHSGPGTAIDNYRPGT